MGKIYVSTMENKAEIKLTPEYVEEAVDPTIEKPAPKRKQKSEAAISGQIATYTLLFLFVFVGFLVWISG